MLGICLVRKCRQNHVGYMCRYKIPLAVTQRGHANGLLILCQAICICMLSCLLHMTGLQYDVCLSLGYECFGPFSFDCHMFQLSAGTNVDDLTRI